MKTPPIMIRNGTVELVDDTAVTILREVTVKVEDAGTGKLAFEGTAKGDSFDRVSINGTVDIKTCRVEFKGDLARLVVSETLRSRVPSEWRPGVDKLNLTAGELDVTCNHVLYDPSATPALTYDISGRLRGGVWNCPRLPFPLNDLTGGFAARAGVFTVARAEGFYGETAVHVDKAAIALDDPERGPLTLDLDVIDLMIDDAFKARTPQLDAVWKEFRPRGRVTVHATAARAARDAPIRSRVVVDCLDVALLYKNFQYPVDHVRGHMVWADDRVIVTDMRTLVGGRSLTAKGTVDHPGLYAVANLEFQAEAVPIDKALLDAMPPEVRTVLDDFKPTGTVRGTVSVIRTPPKTPDADPRGDVQVDAFIDLNERCGMTWKGMPYPINNLTGRLEIHPDLWIFQNMRGFNGQAVLTGSGRVRKVGGTPQQPDLTVDLSLRAEKLPFDDQLRAALPPAWQKSWEILQPTGSCDADATIAVRPGDAPGAKPKENYVLKIVPRPATNVTLSYSRPAKPGVDPGGTFELPMEHVSGLFVFNNGPVDMHDVSFKFYGAPVQFKTGRVMVADSGKFELGVRDVSVRDIRLDQRLRTIMPPVMAQFAARLDDGRTFTFRSNLGLGWPGTPGAPVWCTWDEALIVLNDNAVQIQPGLSLEHMQGQLDHVRGRTDGEAFDLHGALRLESVELLGQQITQLESPIDVDHGIARLTDVRGKLLGGTLTGTMNVSLDETPRYSAKVAVKAADLQQYARTLRGRQTFRGLVDARFEVSGIGGEARRLQGSGEAHITHGDLGELPTAVRLLKVLRLSPATKTAFDSADLAVTIRDGKSYLDPVRLTGDAFSLHGRGTMDVQGDLNLRLQVLYGRDRMYVRGLSDLVREASGQFLVVAVRGTPSFPSFTLEPLPEAVDAVKSLGQRQNADEREKRR